MNWDSRLDSFLEDEVTIEPPTTRTQAQAQSYGPPVTYPAQVFPWVERVITPVGAGTGRNAEGREVRSTGIVRIKDRVAIDQKSRLTLPAGWVPQQPPILGVRPMKGAGLAVTEILF